MLLSRNYYSKASSCLNYVFPPPPTLPLYRLLRPFWYHMPWLWISHRSWRHVPGGPGLYLAWHLLCMLSMLWKFGRSDLFLQEGQAALQETCSFCEFLKVNSSGVEKKFEEKEENWNYQLIFRFNIYGNFEK